jgi:hypothetical protein
MRWREIKAVMVEVLLALAIVAIVAPGVIWWAQLLWGLLR